ncbi:helix-turn-helix domain-containing protein [Nitrospirillum amazonense]|uniref:helix-turn-helix domain-containing protein n=1 Tax=Nitrospirillum amazonense TaxID=28077 RepID=UPI00241233BB|nr:XRE family transcriptional regulator [Nitrospirillum amazonense]MDG3444319.1 XRE family transcriptional regulator [Nitrospirillum amazonense]
MSDGLIAARIKVRREALGFTQDGVTKLLGFSDRQTLSAIENGDRRVSASELVRFAEVLAAPLTYFTDPFLLAGVGRFSWRQAGVPPQKLADYEEHAGRLIALYRALGTELGRRPPLLRQALGLTKASSYEEAMVAGERFAEEFGLGPVPSRRLAEVMQERLGILVLMVDAIRGVSGAACHLPELDAVLINRQEVAGRRHYDLAHELFHILTWDAMPPDHLEDTVAAPKGRVEQLADNFAAAVLMPSSVIAPFGPWADLADDALVSRLNDTAEALGVSASALRWRLVAAGMLTKGRAKTVDENALRNNGRKPVAVEAPPLFSRPFAELVTQAVDEGLISARKVAGLLDMPLDDVADAFAAQGVAFDPGL